MATPPPKKPSPAAPSGVASPRPADHGASRSVSATEEAKDDVSSIRQGGTGPPGMPSGVPSVAPTRVELRKGSAPKAPGVPRDLLGSAKGKASPPAPSGAEEAAERTAEDGLIELADLDIEVVRNPTDAPDATPSSEPPSTQKLSAICDFGRYEILGRIAFGGMAEIFLARESAEAGASRYLVIKRILPHVADDESFVRMFLDEARLAMQLNHPNICHIYEFGQLDGSYFISMEWINGVQLGKLIRRSRAEGGVPASIGVAIISRIAEALHYAHRAKDQMGRPMGIVHRDVSPHNIMVSYDGNVKLLDFGIAKASTHATKTQAGVIKGKFSYMSPQQCLGQPIDGRADVFALGVCLYEVLTGKPLYHRKTEYETMRAVIEEPVPSIRESKPELPEALDRIVQRALAKSEGERHRSAGALQEELEAWLADERRIVNAAKIGDFMEELYAEEISRGPLVDSTPFGKSLNQYPGSPSGSGRGVSKPNTGSRSTETGQAAPASRTPLYVGGAIAAAALIVAAVALTSGREEPPTPQATAPAPEPVPEPEPPVLEDEQPVEPETPAIGALVIRSTPSGASITLGERRLTETTPTILTEVPAGTHPIVLEHAGYEPWRGEVEVVADRRANVSAQLERVQRVRAPAAPPGRLSINTRPWSKVYVGNRLLGTTPVGGAAVPSGNLRLRLVDRDGRTHHRTVEVEAGGEARAFFDLN